MAIMLKFGFKEMHHDYIKTVWFILKYCVVGNVQHVKLQKSDKLYEMNQK